MQIRTTVAGLEIRRRRARTKGMTMVMTIAMMDMARNMSMNMNMDTKINRNRKREIDPNVVDTNMIPRLLRTMPTKLLLFLSQATTTNLLPHFPFLQIISIQVSTSQLPLSISRVLTFMFTLMQQAVLLFFTLVRMLMFMRMRMQGDDGPLRRVVCRREEGVRLFRRRLRREMGRGMRIGELELRMSADGAVAVAGGWEWDVPGLRWMEKGMEPECVLLLRAFDL